MKAEAAAGAARLLAEAWRMGARLQDMPAEIRPKTLADSYRVQERLVAEIAIAPGGWKIGCTSAAARKILKARAPFAGRVIGTRIFASGVILPSSGYAVRGIEGEFAFRLKSALPARKRAYGRAEVAAAVGALHPAIEVVDPRFAEFTKVSLPCVVADLGANGALVLGPAVPRWRTLNLAKVAVRMTVDSQTVGEGTGGAVMGNPIDALVWLANWARTRGGLAAGEIVSTGTCTGFQIAPASCHVVADFGRLGKVAVDFS